MKIRFDASLCVRVSLSLPKFRTLAKILDLLLIMLLILFKHR